MPEILVGVDGSNRSEDALSFASQLAAVTGANLALLVAFAPGDRPPRPAKNALREHAGEVTRKTLMRMRGLVDRESVATCPVIVVPRAGCATLSELFSQPSLLDEARTAGAQPAIRAVGRGWTSPRRIA
jgi:hypothetical protein